MRKVFYTHDIITFGPLLLLTYKYTNRKERQIMNKPLKELLNLNKIVETYFSCYLHLENNNLNIVLKLKTDKLHTVYLCKCDVENMLFEVTFNGSTADIIKLDVYIKAVVDNAYIKHDSKMFIISDNQVFEY